MMRKLLKEIISGGVVGVSPDEPFKDVIKLMRDKSISCIPVLVDGKPVGIFTERHMVNLLVKDNGTSGNKSISELMAKPVVTAKHDLFIYEAYHLFETHGIRHLVVVDDKEKAIGVLTLSNLMEQIGEEFFVEFQPVSKLMSKSVQTVKPDATLDTVLEKMVDLGISCVVCVDKGKPAGILTERDMVSLIEGGKNLETVLVREVMHSPVITVSPDLEIHEAAKMMREKGIRRLVVVDKDGKIKGLATQTNIVRGLESKYVKVLKELLIDREHRLKTAFRERDELSLYLKCILDTSMDMGIVGADTDLKVIYCNDAAHNILGEPVKDSVGRKLTEITALTGGSSESLQRILKKVRSEGSYNFAFSCSKDDEDRYYQARVAGVWDRGKKLVGYVYMVQDITERKKAEENIRYMAYHDILTGLPNRVAFDERLSLEMARADRNKLKLAVMVLDLNRFKEVNDRLGHFAGDLLLQEVAHRMQSCLRKSDTLARYGGDEFILVLPEIEGPKDAELIAEKLIRTMDKPVDLQAEAHTPTFSIGVALYPKHATKRNTLIEAADQAMYRAKQAGRDSGRSNYILADAILAA